ncbi:MAG: homoserine kinase [Acidobacteriota bacterium]
MRGFRAFAPATVANMGPGLDILGLALSGAGDVVTAFPAPGGELVLRSSGHPELSVDPERNTAGIAAAAVRRRAGATASGIALDVVKGLPLSGGQGGSAASAVAAAFAVNAFLGSPLSRAELLEPCLEAEEAVSGRHADNVAPALFGGVVLVRSLDPPDVVELRWPQGLLVVLAEPEQRLSTGEARSRLPDYVPREIAISQAANVGSLVAALSSGDFALLRRSIEDRIAEPVRAGLLPGFVEAKAAALDAGAFGCSISGSGPAAFAFADGAKSAERISAAMRDAYTARGIVARVRVTPVDGEGARLLTSPEVA